MALALDADRGLALTYVPARRRAAVEALWRLDLALGSVLATGREPAISQIRLAWWRESLEKLDVARAPSEPVLEALARDVLPQVKGAELSQMEAGWAELLQREMLSTQALADYAQARGALLFRYSARLLGGASNEAVERAGEAWALIDLARHSANAPERDAALAAARERLRPGQRWPSPLRPLGMLAALADRDVAGEPFEPHGAPSRMLRMLRHRLTGR